MDLVSLIHRAKAGSTTSTYKVGIQRYLTFCNALDLALVLSTKRQVALFATHLSSSLRLPTIQVYLSAASFLHHVGSRRWTQEPCEWQHHLEAGLAWYPKGTDTVPMQDTQTPYHPADTGRLVGTSWLRLNYPITGQTLAQGGHATTIFWLSPHQRVHGSCLSRSTLIFG